MSALLTSRGEHLCQHCRYSLEGLRPIGRCPECGEPYWLSQATPSHSPREWAEAIARYLGTRMGAMLPAFRSFAITLFVLTFAAITITIGWAAWEALLRKIDSLRW